MTSSCPSPSFPLPKENQNIFWRLNAGRADAWLIAQAAMQSGSLITVITTDMPSAEHMEAALQFFLRDADEPIEIITLPDWETLPYDVFSPHQDIVSQRIRTLYRLPKLSRGILILPITTALLRLAPTAYIQGAALSLKTGEVIDLVNYRRSLEQAGYRCVDTVFEHGEFAVRGSILDIYPMGSDTPYRVEFFDDEIETLRSFDPESQRSKEQIEGIELLPAHEFPLSDAAVKHFRIQFYEQFADTPRNCPILQDVNQGIASPGLEYYLPLFFESAATLFDYLPENSLIVLQEGLHERCEVFWREVRERHDELAHDTLRPILPPKEIFLKVEEFFENVKRQPRIQLKNELPEPGSEVFKSLPEIAIDSRKTDPLFAVKTMQSEANCRVLISAESAGRREVLTETFKTHGINLEKVSSLNEFLTDSQPWAITTAELSKGFLTLGEAGASSIAVVAEADLYEGRVLQRRRRKRTQDSGENVIQNLTELKIGSPVVHIDHGIGRYQGLQSLEVGGQKQEFLVLHYAEESKLYVPVASLHLISRYTGLDPDLAPINKLGTEKWSNAKQKAAEKIRDTAAELLEVYARREANVGYANSGPDTSYHAFSAAFPFEETPDQINAIDAVIRDMTAKKPMDRLVCGDVGFGKTEVAMRAAFLAASTGRQVAVLVPTTLLAQQHFQSFNDRFADTPINIELVSRFRTAADTEKVTKRLAEGKVDIIVGTHKLLSKGIAFKNLGLLIIDEEHRFGVQQKEKMKALRANIDILALTATPIPRTLNLSFQGIRDLSIISTPPEKRLSVKTFVRERSESLVKEAILREILRGGQVFFLHNEVKSIDRCVAELAELVPDARVIAAHGQMRERDLERVMSEFYHKKHNVLVCSTIIETGIDIPSANTIIIERADNFGLAQLHQLRGRVGRSHHQAYAYLLTPPPRNITEDARKRLEAISGAQDLGAGFTLATHDLEIRGAGELLGEEQSGQIHSIGFTLYMQLLDEAVKAMREGRVLDLTQPLDHGCEINLRLPALIPDDYLPDVHNRLILYKRIANSKTADHLQALQVEMIDRFGLLPEATKNLFRVTRFKQVADRLGISKLELGDKGGNLEFTPNTKVEPIRLVNLIQQEPQRYRLEGGSKLKITEPLAEREQRLQFTEELLAMFN